MSPVLDSLFLSVARTRQDSKKDLLVHHDTRHLLLLLSNAEGPTQCTYFRNLKKNTTTNCISSRPSTSQNGQISQYYQPISQTKLAAITSFEILSHS
jgi:hypothetical protein